MNSVTAQWGTGNNKRDDLGSTSIALIASLTTSSVDHGRRRKHYWSLQHSVSRPLGWFETCPAEPHCTRQSGVKTCVCGFNRCTRRISASELSRAKELTSFCERSCPRIRHPLDYGPGSQPVLDGLFQWSNGSLLHREDHGAPDEHNRPDPVHPRS